MLKTLNLSGYWRELKIDVPDSVGIRKHGEKLCGEQRVAIMDEVALAVETATASVRFLPIWLIHRP